VSCLRGRRLLPSRAEIVQKWDGAPKDRSDWIDSLPRESGQYPEGQGDTHGGTQAPHACGADDKGLQGGEAKGEQHAEQGEHPGEPVPATALRGTVSRDKPGQENGGVASETEDPHRNAKQL